MRTHWSKLIVPVFALLQFACGGEEGPQSVTFFEGSRDAALAKAADKQR